MLLATHKGSPTISLTTQSNHSHFLLFRPLLKCFRFIIPSLCFPLIHSHEMKCFGESLFVSLSFTMVPMTIFLTFPLSLHRLALIRDDDLQPFLWHYQGMPFKGAWLPYHTWDSRLRLTPAFMLPKPKLVQDLANETLAKQYTIMVCRLLLKITLFL